MLEDLNITELEQVSGGHEGFSYWCGLYAGMALAIYRDHMP